MTAPLSPAAQIIAGLSPESDLIRRAADALESLSVDDLDRWAKRSGLYLVAENLTPQDFVALQKDDSAVVAAAKARRAAS